LALNVLGFGLTRGYVNIVVVLFEIYLVRGEFVLATFVSNNIIGVVIRVLQGGLGLPVGGTSVRDFWLLLVHSNRLLLDVATTEDR